MWDDSVTGTRGSGELRVYTDASERASPSSPLRPFQAPPSSLRGALKYLTPVPSIGGLRGLIGQKLRPLRVCAASVGCPTSSKGGEHLRSAFRVVEAGVCGVARVPIMVVDDDAGGQLGGAKGVGKRDSRTKSQPTSSNGLYHLECGGQWRCR